ncbi:MAG: WD40 repeat domain-containing protein [Bacteroidota bacterium]|jgi:WD40 repeat protein|nr:WD40 repeat domain-containing protein [Sphingobacteriales bacterium]
MVKLNVSKIAHFSGHKDAVFALCASTQANTFYSGGADGYIVEWDIESKQNGKLLVQVPRPVYCLHVMQKEQLLICGTAEGNMHAVDLTERKEIRNIEAHVSGIYDIKETVHHLITAGGDGKVLIWDKGSFNLVKVLHYASKSARVIAINPHENIIAVGYSDCFIRFFDANYFELLNEIKAHDNSVFGLAFSGNGKVLLSGGRDAELKLWHHEHFLSRKQSIPAHLLHINAIQFNPEGNFFATVSMDKTIKIWDALNVSLLKVVDKVRNDGHLSSVNKILWHKNRQFITCSDDKTVMMWELDFVQ